MIKRPARVQLDPALVKENSKPEQSGQVFNIWYNKWCGGENNGRTGLVHAKHRCDVKRDSGYTKADKYVKPGEINKSDYFCLYFARGYCCNGKKCDYLHRIPTDLDIFPTTVDCFGREKFMDYRDDMSGIGSFGKVNKTLYINRISDMHNNIEMRLSKCFGEFGDVSYVKALPGKNAAFVSFKLESQAQFAKESMYGQSLTPGNTSETLDIRWANDDPKYSARKRARDEENEMSMETARKLLQILKEQNSAKKQKTESPGKEQLHNYNQEKFDDTDAQNYQQNGIQLNLLQTLAKQRSESINSQPSTSIVTGYSSSEEDDN